MSREIELAIEYLQHERMRHQQQCLSLARDTRRAEDYIQISTEAKLADCIRGIITDLQLLDSNAGEFIQRFLQEKA